MTIHKSIADTLAANQKDIINLWMSEARKVIPAAKNQSVLALQNSLPDFLECLTRDLLSGESWEEKIREAEAGTEHGKQRFELGTYDLRQVINEYHILRRVIIHLLVREMRAEIAAVSVVNDAIDRGITNAADIFAKLERNELTQERDQSRSEVSERDRFVASVSHDLRNPIGSAQMALELIMEEIKDHPPAHELAEIAHRSLHSAAELLTDLLDIHRVKAGQNLPINLDDLELRAFCEQILRNQRDQLGDLFLLDAPTQVPGIWCQRSIHRMLDNLLGNAFKYGDRSQPITLRVRQDENCTTLSVHNYGKPIAPIDQVTIFEAFVRSRSLEGAQKKDGWGLGLALVKAVALAHGGTVALTSSAAEGTQFTVTLPNDARPFLS